ncbi:MAG: hypothetical protein IJ619_12400 [Eubacterium sp.]|nr:hypothetical protein [Eubacterium sp.]
MKEVDDLFGEEIGVDGEVYSKDMSIEEKFYHAKKMNDKYQIHSDSDWVKSFFGNKYNKSNIQSEYKGHDNLSLDRTAGASIASLALLMEKDSYGNPKYTLEQILNPKKFVDEKQDMFDKIIKLTGDSSEESRTALGKLIYDGLKNGSMIMDQMTDELDMDDPTVELSDKFQMLSKISAIMHDAWQELAGNKKWLIDNTSKDRPECTDEKSAHEYTKNKFCGPFALWTSEATKYINESVNYYKGKDSQDGKVLIAAFNLQNMKNTFKKCKKSGKSASDYYLDDKTGTKVISITSHFGMRDDVQGWFSELQMNPKLSQNLYKQANSGELFKYTSVTAVPQKNSEGYLIEYSNMPTLNLGKNKFDIKVPKSSKVAEAPHKSGIKEPAKKPKKLPVNFDSYIKLHTGEGGFKGKNQKDKCEAVCKVLAAYSLKKLGRDFSLKEIHKMSKHIATTYVIEHDMMKSINLDEILKDKKSVLAFGQKRREKYYSIKPNDYGNFVDEMKKISDNMISEKGHSDEYKAFVRAVRKAASLNDNIIDMTPEKKAEVFLQAGLDVVHAADKYIEGREKISRKQERNDCINNALDALAAVSRYTSKDKGQPMNLRITDIIARIQKKRNDINDGINMVTFEDSYGGKRAETRRKQIDARKQKKPKEQAHNMK